MPQTLNIQIRRLLKGVSCEMLVVTKLAAVGQKGLLANPGIIMCKVQGLC